MGEILSVEDAERAALHERCAQLWESHEALRAEVERLGMQADYWKAKVLPLEARLAEVEQALRTYGRHTDKCFREMTHWRTGEDCTCGFAAVLDKGEQG